jgi:hypothetical protein
MISLEETLARERIRDTMARYNIGGDTRNLPQFLDTFTEDAVYESSPFHCVGKAKIHEYLSVAWNAKPSRPVARFRRHNLTTSQVDFLSPTTAKARTYYLVVTDLGPDHSGFYLDYWREDHGRWLMSHRQVWMDWTRPDSLFVPDISKKMLLERGTCGPEQHLF